MLLETLRCEEGKALHLSYHQKRLDDSLHTLNIKKTYDLSALIFPPKLGTYRCRFLYDASGYTVEFHPYTPKKITSLKLLTCNTLEYPLKYADRGALNLLFEQRETCDDVLIVKNAVAFKGNWTAIILFTFSGCDGDNDAVALLSFEHINVYLSVGIA